MSNKDSLGDRMKKAEMAARTSLPGRMPIIMRLDGKAFHTYTKKCKRPFDEKLVHVMNETAKAVCSEVQGAQLAYVQSDEISILIHNYKTFTSQSWFDNAVQKMTSVSAGIASSAFTAKSWSIFDDGLIRPAVFDSRVFILPEADVCNYFIWRQQDMERNSISMLAQSLYSHKQLHGKSSKQNLHNMLHEKGVNWNDLPTSLKRGRTIVKKHYEVNGSERSKWEVDEEMPILTQNREYINKYLEVDES